MCCYIFPNKLKLLTISSVLFVVWARKTVSYLLIISSFIVTLSQLILGVTYSYTWIWIKVLEYEVLTFLLCLLDWPTISRISIDSFNCKTEFYTYILPLKWLVPDLRLVIYSTTAWIIFLLPNIWYYNNLRNLDAEVHLKLDVLFFKRSWCSYKACSRFFLPNPLISEQLFQQRDTRLPQQQSAFPHKSSSLWMPWPVTRTDNWVNNGARF